MRRLRPDDRAAVLASLEEEPDAGRRVAEVGGVEHSPLGGVAHLPESLHPRLEIDAALRGIWAATREKWTPLDELRNVFDEYAAHVERRQPPMHNPRVHAEIVVDGLAATSSRV